MGELQRRMDLNIVLVVQNTFSSKSQVFWKLEKNVLLSLDSQLVTHSALNLDQVLDLEIIHSLLAAKLVVCEAYRWLESSLPPR